MNGILPLAFAAPATLLALLALPAIWWLLRLTPPRPTVVDFPPTPLMRDLAPPDDTPAHTPWWLLVLRLGLAACVIFALAAPVWRPGTADDGAAGPLWLILDDGWTAAEDWPAMRAAADARLAEAAARGRPVVLAGSADGADQPFAPTAAAEARRRLAVLAPRPWADDRDAVLAGLDRARAHAAPGSIVWIAAPADAAPREATVAFADGLARRAAGAPLAVLTAGRLAIVAIDRLDNAADAVRVGLVRPPESARDAGRLAALDRRGRRLAEMPWRFEPGATRIELRLDLPLDLRNDVARVELVDVAEVGAVRLADDRWRRRAVGVVSGAGFERDQPLLAPTHYLDAALAPFAELRRPRHPETGAAIDDLIAGGLSVLVLADVGALDAATTAKLGAWIDAGGLLVRFAGPRLTGARADDPLLPVPLRRGERALGGALSWASPRGLGPFSPTGPFAGLTPPDDVRIARQILAEPGPDLATHTWASLDDGTPLVTATPRGRGRIVLFHVGADTAWSNLPLSGGFVDMLRRIVALAGQPPRGAETEATPSASAAALLPPWRLLDGFGRLGAPGPEARPIAAAEIAAARPSRLHPPGLWGHDDAVTALHLVHPGDELAALAPRLAGIGGVSVTARTADRSTPLAPALLVAALVLALLDGLVALGPVLRRPGRALRRAAGLAALAAALVLAVPPASDAADATPDPAAEATARDAALAPRLAHVLTGDAATDEIARRGLLGLSRILAERTAFEPAEPIGIDPARDDLSVLPLLYWPISPTAPQPSPRALARIDAFMKNGGTVLFDSRDADETALLAGTGRTTPAGAALRRILAALDLPELEPVPPDHVLGRTFYLLQAFPGRADGRLWVEASPEAEPARAADRPARPGDGVSPILVTGNDLAGAWAVTDDGDDLLPMTATEPRAREMALRAGVNIVMYVLTGNYKADQVHVPALLERLGR